MNKSIGNSNDGAGEMDDVGRLIELVGAREPVPAERLERARQKVRQHWQHVVDEHRAARRPRRFKAIAIAAGMVVCVGSVLTFWSIPRPVGVESLASVERVMGEALIAGKVTVKGDGIAVNTPIVTDGDSRMALRMSGGQSLRIDSASRVILHSPNHVSLQAGALYIDTAFAAQDRPVLVSTPLGTAQDIGTQFQVRLAGEKLVVGVRQGLVEVSQAGKQSLSINTGYYVELGDAGESNEQPLKADDPDWKWIETIAPEFDIQGASLEQYLRWYAHESGMELIWADEESAEKARKAILSGSIAGVGLEESLAIVRKVAPFEFQINAKIILVEVQ